MSQYSSVHLYTCPTDQVRCIVYLFLPGRVHVCECAFSLTQGPGTEARCNRLFQRLGWLARCSDLSAAGRPANTSLLTAVLQLAVYYCRGPRLRPPGADSYMPILLLTVCELVCVRETGCQSAEWHLSAAVFGVFDETCCELTKDFMCMCLSPAKYTDPFICVFVCIFVPPYESYPNQMCDLFCCPHRSYAGLHLADPFLRTCATTATKERRTCEGSLDECKDTVKSKYSIVASMASSPVSIQGSLPDYNKMEIKRV